MTAGKDFVFVTQNNGHLFMWLDEPVKDDSGEYTGKQPYVNSAVFKKIRSALGSSKINGFEVVTW